MGRHKNYWKSRRPGKEYRSTPAVRSIAGQDDILYIRRTVKNIKTCTGAGIISGCNVIFNHTIMNISGAAKPVRTTAIDRGVIADNSIFYYQISFNDTAQSF
jgi:hypothetical protein